MDAIAVVELGRVSAETHGPSGVFEPSGGTGP